MRKIVPTLFILLVAVTAAAQSAPQPELALKDLDGRLLRLSDYKGQVVLINFWATWCVPCRTEIPDLIKLQRRYRSEGLRIVGIAQPPGKRSEVRALARKLKMNYPVAL